MNTALKITSISTTNLYNCSKLLKQSKPPSVPLKMGSLRVLSTSDTICAYKVSHGCCHDECWKEWVQRQIILTKATGKRGGKFLTRPVAESSIRLTQPFSRASTAPEESKSQNCWTDQVGQRVSKEGREKSLFPRANQLWQDRVLMSGIQTTC